MTKNLISPCGLRTKSLVLSGPQIMEGDITRRLKARDKGYTHKLKLHHKNKWMMVRDRYYEHKWVIELGMNHSYTIGKNGRCLYMTPKLNPRILYKALKFYVEMEPTLYNSNYLLPEVRKGLQHFLQDFRRIHR